MSIAIKRLERAIGDLPKGGMQTGAHKVKLDLSDAERLIVELNALQAERDALAAQLVALNKLHSDLTNADIVLDDGEHSGYLITSEQMEDMEHYLSEPIICLAAHDAEVAKKAVQSALRMYGNTDLNNKEIIALSESYAASLKK